jgi:hypothetical protein
MEIHHAGEMGFMRQHVDHLVGQLRAVLDGNQNQLRAMDGRLDRLEARVREMGDELQRLEARVRAIGDGMAWWNEWR